MQYIKGIVSELLQNIKVNEIMEPIKYYQLNSRAFCLEDIIWIKSNKTVKYLRNLINELTRLNLEVTSYGDLNKTNISGFDPLYLMRAWEYASLIDLSGVTKKSRVLDAGGASSPLVFELASMGVKVVSVDLMQDLVKNTNEVAQKMSWPLTAQRDDMIELPFDDNSFDFVFSVSVLEHMSNDLKQKAVAELARVLKPKGILGLTFDYGQSSGIGYYYGKDQGFGHEPLSSVAEIERLLICPSNLHLYNQEKLLKEPYIFTAYRGSNLKFVNFILHRVIKPLIRKNPPYTFFRLFLEK